MDTNGDNDFDAAAFGLPTGFGAVSKQIPKKQKQAKADVAAFDSTKRSEAPNGPVVDVTDVSVVRKSAPEVSAATTSAAPIQSTESHLDGREEPEAGPSSGFVRNGGSSRQDYVVEDGQDDVDDHQDDDDDDAQGGDDTEYFPVSHEIVMKDHTKAVTALAVDPPGARVITGGYDYDVKLWDFGGMQADFRPFRSFEPYENYHIHDVAWDSTGSNFVVIPGTLTPKLYDRDGNELAEFAKGDMYLRDLKNTAGHVGQLTSVCWHPTDSTKFMTSSMDSTMRIWDTSDRFKSKTTIVVKSKERGNRTKITNATYSIDGRQIAAAGTDGTINVWATNSNFARPNHTTEAHEKGTETSSLTFSLDNRTLASRGGDGTVKLWDIRKFKKPLSVASDLISNNPETNVIFSPDEKYVLTGTTGPKAGLVPGKEVDVRGKPGGRIVVMKRDNLEIVREYNVSEGSVIRLAWHSRINQILASTSLGEVKVLYSPTLSEKGATLAAARAPRQRRALDDYVDPADQPIITPHALPMFKDSNAYEVSDAGTATKRKRENVRNNAQKSRKPDVPVRGPGHGGRVGEAADRHMVAGMAGDMRSEDPREALLKYATKEGDKQWTKAWGADQKTLYDNTPEPDAPTKK